jgi:hypothetical protein
VPADGSADAAEPDLGKVLVRFSGSASAGSWRFKTAPEEALPGGTSPVVKARLVVLFLTAGLAVSSAALAARTTTAPGEHALIYVRITDKGLTVFDGGTMPRGVIATFEAINDGKKSHNFIFLGKKTPVIKPGHRAKFTVHLLTRGNFPYKSTVNAPGKFFRGFFTVT